MNPLILKFADGTFFFIGLFIIAITGLILTLWPHARWTSRLTIPALMGSLFVALSTTPLPIWAYSIGITSCGLSLVLLRLNKRSTSRRVCAGLLVLASAMALGLTEANFHASPTLAVFFTRPLYVLGDSISAGMGTGEKCWPAVLKEIGGLNVINLSEAGATVASARKQADRISNENSVVVVEIGGNDLLGITTTGQFREQLDALIASLREHKHDVLMFELPLPPLCFGFGYAQREIANKYGVKLIPKRYLTHVLAMEGSTLDGLHLSQSGHNALAAEVNSILQKR